VPPVVSQLLDFEAQGVAEIEHFMIVGLLEQDRDIGANCRVDRLEDGRREMIGVFM